MEAGTPLAAAIPADAPRGVLLRFGIYSALALALAGGALLWFVRADTRKQAEQQESAHTQFVANTILQDHLGPVDLAAPARGARLAQLDSLFRREILVGGAVRAKLYTPKGLVLYSNDHGLIGGTSDELDSIEAVTSGHLVRDVSSLNHEGGNGRNIKVLESYVPLRLRGSSRIAAVFELYQNYQPVAASVSTVGRDVAIALVLALLALYIALFPVLRRMTAALERRNRRLTDRTVELGDALAKLGDALDHLRASEHELASSREETIRRLSVAAEYRDEDTGHHIERMSRYSAVLARELGFDANTIELIRIASPLHDVGKIATPDAILLKPGALTPEERVIMEEHARVGSAMLADSTSELLQLAATIAGTHHEKIDGSGYPNGLRGEQIPLVGRIAAVADVFDALTSDRVYRPAMSVERALEIMREGRGSHFDDAVFAAFENSLHELLSIRTDLADRLQAA